MTKTDTRDVAATLRQIAALQKAGCQVVRVAVPDAEAARALGRIKARSPLPIVADVHFDWRLALEALRQGADGLRINPGNIGARWKLKELVRALADRPVPLRVGVNAGSLPRDILRKFRHPCPEALLEAALREVQTLEELGYSMIKVSLKASSVPLTVQAYRLFSERTAYPLHLGISEAGPPEAGIIKSAVGLGVLLSEGIGDTLRVSLSASAVLEIRVAWGILQSLGLGPPRAEVISCPTCGRCSIDIRRLARKTELALRDIRAPVKVAVMGCVVNGPGEAREADVGITGARGKGIIFRKGRVLRTVKEEHLLQELLRELRAWRP
jgi:(E)-4-hydroxy-3-methylbut-2-enyl-diphosphate synthase